MKKVMLVWELGAGLGHISTFLPIVESLKLIGYKPYLILRDVTQMENIYHNVDVDYIQAPICNLSRVNGSNTQLNFTDTLFNFGYLDSQVLIGMVKSWSNIFSLIQPDLFIFDYAPTALLASRMFNQPKIILGNCFAVPPQESPLPLYQPWKKQADCPIERVKKEEKQCVLTINRMLKFFSLHPISSVREIYTADYCFITTDPLLDIYSRTKNIEHLGSISTQEIGRSDIQWPLDKQYPKVFVYIKSDYKHIDHLLSCLVVSKAQYVVYSVGLSRQIKCRYNSDNIFYSDSPYNIMEVRKKCDAAIIHGGNLIDKFLEVGVPILLLPIQIENLMMANKVIESGAAISFPLGQPIKQLASLIENISSDKSLKANAVALASRMLKLSQKSQMSRIIRVVDYLLMN